MSRRRSSAPFVLTVVLGSLLAAALVGWWIPRQKRERILANERRAAAALKLLTVAEVDFRSNDRDGNGIWDFWVADVSGLFSLTDPRSPDRPIALISLELARADGRPLRPSPGPPAPYSGYFFVALRFDQGEEPGTLVPYADAVGRNPSAFGFCAYPAEYGRTGIHTFVVNEGNTIFKFDMGGKPLIRWPLDRVLNTDYEK